MVISCTLSAIQNIIWKIFKKNYPEMSCSFGGRRAALIVADGRIVIREKDVKDDIASFPPCGALSIALNGISLIFVELCCVSGITV